MTNQSPTTFTPNLVIGIGIALLGVVLILDRLDMVTAQDVLRFWPILLVLFGASVVAQALRGRSDEPRQRPMVSPGLIFFIVIATVFFSQGYRRDGSQGFWRDGIEQGRSSGDTTSQFNVMSRSYRASTSQQFRRGDLTSVMGAASLDLREAMIPPGGEAVVDVFAMMGRVELIVPDGWTVEIDAVPIMGAIKDNRFRSSLRIDDQRLKAEATGAEAAGAEAPPTPAAAPPRVVLRGFVMMGAVVVRS